MSNFLSKDVEQERYRLYYQGLSDLEIAQKTFYEQRTIGAWRRSKKLPSNVKYNKPLTKEDKEKRMKLYNLGYGDKRIAKECGVSKGAISQWRCKNKLKSNYLKGNNEAE